MARPRFRKLKVEKQSRILEAAAAEFTAHGYNGASYNRIIAEAGVSKGAMYYYFDDKEDLFITVLTHRLAFLKNLLDPALFEISDVECFWQKLEGGTRAFYQTMAESPDNIALARVGMQAISRGELSEWGASMMGGIEAITQQWLELGQRLGAIRQDVPQSLLSRWLMAIGEASDLWLMDHWESLDGEAIESIFGKILQAFRLLCQPQSP